MEDENCDKDLEVEGEVIYDVEDEVVEDSDLRVEDEVVEDDDLRVEDEVVETMIYVRRACYNDVRLEEKENNLLGAYDAKKHVMFYRSRFSASIGASPMDLLSPLRRGQGLTTREEGEAEFKNGSDCAEKRKSIGRQATAR
ncbi:Protein of unknown function [Gryllus bimaculatus]|nr:Protein of unknown function [Gryllus bimaculatus]